jgi:hypothetical protein
MTIDEIAERLAVSRTTIYGWVGDIPIERKCRGKRNRPPTPAELGRAEANRARYRELREAAYAQGAAEYARLSREPTFRDFVCMYIGEGYKRCRNTVSLGNSDPAVVVLGARWIRRLTQRRVSFSVQYHVDQDLEELRAFWSDRVGTPPHTIRMQRKSNSNGLKGRNWRSQYGVLTVCSKDTYLRARLQSWMDLVRLEWA